MLLSLTVNLHFEILSPLLKVKLFILVCISRFDRVLYVHDLVPLQVQFVQHLVVALKNNNGIFALRRFL